MIVENLQLADVTIIKKHASRHYNYQGVHIETQLGQYFNSVSTAKSKSGKAAGEWYTGQRIGSLVPNRIERDQCANSNPNCKKRNNTLRLRLLLGYESLKILPITSYGCVPTLSRGYLTYA